MKFVWANIYEKVMNLELNCPKNQYFGTLRNHLRHSFLRTRMTHFFKDLEK